MGSQPLAFALIAVLWAVVSKGQTGESGEQKLDFRFDAPVDLTRYESYRWSKDQVAVVNLANHIRLVNAIQRHMKELGYRIDTVKPDVTLRYRAERHTGLQTRSTQTPSQWDPTDRKVQVELSREEQFTLSVEITETESGFLLWQAKGTYPLGTPDRAEKLINEAVADLFAKYPRPEEKRK